MQSYQPLYPQQFRTKEAHKSGYSYTCSVPPFPSTMAKVTTGSAISDKIDEIKLLLYGIKIKGLNLNGMKIPEIEVEF